MFDGLQQGIVVIQRDKTMFMNDLCTKMFARLSELFDFQNNLQSKTESGAVHAHDIKMFYLYEQELSAKQKRAKPKKKNATGLLSSS